MRTINRGQATNFNTDEVVAKVSKLSDAQLKRYSDGITDLKQGNISIFQFIDIMKVMFLRLDYEKDKIIQNYKETLFDYLGKETIDVALFKFITQKLEEECTVANSSTEHMNNLEDKKKRIIDYFTTEELLEIEDILLSKMYLEKRDPYDL